VREAVTELIRGSDFPSDELNRIVLAVDEAVANIIEHAYHDVPAGEREITLRLAADGDRFEILVRDSGRRFDPQKVLAPNMSEHVRQGRKSGLGIFLMRKIMDQVHYRFEEDGANELQMIKFSRPVARE
jgi:anti-sigma regulatory factor (Ser/Thr protein kinase)